MLSIMLTVMDEPLLIVVFVELQPVLHKEILPRVCYETFR